MQILYNKLLEWLHANWTKFFSVKTTQQLHDHFMTVTIYHTYMWRTFQRTVGGEQRRYRNLKFKWVIFYYYTSGKSSAEKLMWIFMNECCISSIQIASSVRNLCRLTHTESLKVINYLLKIMMNELFKTAEQTE